MANVVIDIAAEFTGKKAFKQAETATDKITNNVKGLAKTLGAAFSIGAVVAFGKASVKAFAEDEAAASRLTRAVQNLGLGFEDTRIKTFIADLESSAVVADDVLRPAFQSLLNTTGSVTKSQDLLKLAIDVSAGSTESLATVSNDLALAYVGQTKGLKKYDLGLTAAELSTANFEDIQKKLNTRFAGQNAARLDTYAAKMEALNIAFGNAQETVGGGLLDAFSILGGNNGIGSVTNAINEMATAASESIVSIALVVEELQKIPVVGGLLDRLKNPLGLPKEFLAFGKGGLIDQLRALSKESKQYGGIYATKYLGELEAANAAARKKAEAEAAKRAKELLAFKNKQLAAEAKSAAQKKLTAAIEKGQLALGKGGEVFDMEKIQLEAARINQVEQLKKVTNQAQLLAITNDLARLQVLRDMKNLEDAIATGDIKKIEAATKKLNEDLKILGALTNQKLQLVEIKDILNGLVPKSLIDIDNLTKAIGLLNGLVVPKGGTIDIKITDATAAALTAAIAAAAAAGTAATSAAAVAAQISKDAAGTLVKVNEITSTFGAKDILTSIVTATSIAAAVSGRIGTGVSGASDPRVQYGGQRLDSAGNLIGYNAEQAYAMSAEGRAATLAAIEAANKAGLTVNNNFNGIVGDSNALATLIAKIVQDALDRGTIKASPLP